MALLTRFATDDGISAGQVDQDGAGAVIDQAIAEKDRLGIGAVWLQLCVIDEAAAERAHELAGMSS
jgi:predicted CoA-binding protein